MGVGVGVGVGVDVIVVVVVGVGVGVGVPVSGRAEWLLAPTGGNYDALGIDRGGFMTLLASPENSPNFHYHYPTLY
jgi:hypothetical protein